VTGSGAGIGANRYGKQAIRLVKVVRRPDGHVVRDLTIGVTLEGDFARSYTDADNSLVIATDTMKNTAYALAPAHLTSSIEAFGLVLARHFLEGQQVGAATVTIAEHGWERLRGPAGPAPDAFRRAGGATRTAAIRASRDATSVESGVADLVLMKTSRSAFTGFPRDRYTTLPEASERIMATRVTATWRHGTPTDGFDYDAGHAAVLATLLEVFADHDSQSVQHSIWVIGRAMLDRHTELEEVRMTLPNLHHWLVDLTPFGGTNEGEIFVATTEPHGLIEATVRRGEG